MVQAFQRVDGCYLDIPDLHSKIAFSNRSDALFASLVVKYSETLGTAVLNLFDDIIQLLHLEDFTTSQLTIRKPLEVFDRIAIGRRKIAEEREAKNPRNTRDQIVPKLVTDLVADQIEREIPRVLCRQAYFCEYCDESEAEVMLRDFSLVHRTWTSIAQRLLRRHIVVHGIPRLIPALKSPWLGPWVHELVFKEGGVRFEDDHTYLLISIMERCPNVRRLAFRGEHSFSSYTYTYQDLIPKVGNLTHLQQLTVDVYSLNIWDLFSILPVLQRLERLRLHIRNHPRRRTGDEIPHSLRDLKPSPTLQFLTLLPISDDKGPLIWLLEPGASYLPKYLETNAILAERILTLTPSIVSGITGLQLDISSGAFATIPSIVSRFPSLQTVTLCCNNSFSHLPFVLSRLTLPEFVQSFRLHIDTPYADTIRACLSCVESPPPNLRKFLITYSEEGLIGAGAVDAALSAVSQACVGRKIDFEYRCHRHYPTLSDSS